MISTDDDFDFDIDKVVVKEVLASSLDMDCVDVSDDVWLLLLVCKPVRVSV